MDFQWPPKCFSRSCTRHWRDPDSGKVEKKMKPLLLWLPALSFATALVQGPGNATVDARSDKASAITTDQHANKEADLEISRKIRHELSQHKRLAAYATSMRISTIDGKVILRGPVRCDEDKRAIASTAKR